MNVDRIEEAKEESRMEENKTTNGIKIVAMITGVLTVLLGIYTIVRPLRTFLSVGWILGVLLLVNGIELVVISMSKEKKKIGAIVLGVLEAIGGLILLFSGVQRILTDITAAYLVGLCILVYGIYQIINGTKIYKESKGKGVLGIICGILSILISLMSFTHPILTMFSVGYMIAFSILMQGINMIVLAVSIGKNKDQ